MGVTNRERLDMAERNRRRPHWKTTASEPRASVLWLRAALASSLSPATKVVAVGVNRYMDFDYLDRVRPGTDRLARETGLDRRSVERCLATLVEVGWIEKIGGPPKNNGKAGNNGSAGRGRASVYRGLMPNPDGAPGFSPIERPADSTDNPGETPGLADDERDDA